MKRVLSPVRRNSGGSLRQKCIQKLQVLALVFVIILLSLKIYIQMFPNTFDSDMTIPCGKCMSHENQSENIENTDNELTPIDDNTDYNYPEDEITYLQPASHPLPSDSDMKYDFTVVTGASNNHFCPTRSFLYNMKDILKGLNARVIVYDLGFTNQQIKTLKKLQKLGYLTELRKFQWSHYPSFWNISIARGEYAWKPGMIAEVARDYPGKLVWLDSGTLVERKYFVNLDSLLARRKGFISPRSSGTMKVWTHPGVYEYFNDQENYDNIMNCNGASVTFDTTKTKNIIEEWYKCALVKDCIAPPGSSRANHRQDQAILTYLAAKNNLYCNVGKDTFGIRTHEDRHCRKYISDYESTHEL